MLSPETNSVAWQDTGNPISFAALRLHNVLKATIAKLDPDRSDPSLHNIVVVGHNQGGLLAKMLMINAGSRLFDALSTKSIDDWS